LKCSIKRVKQRSIRERLQETFNCPALAQTLTGLFVAVRRNKNNWNLPPLVRQFTLELDSRPARHCDVENHTLGLIDPLRREEFFRRGERLSLMAEDANEVRQRFPNGFVIIDNCDILALLHHAFPIASAESAGGTCMGTLADSPTSLEGTEKQNVEPGPSLRSAQRWP
jgi:hypothetical protein